MYTTLSLNHLPLGASLSSDIFDSQQLKLLAAGATITDTLLQNLRMRGVSQLSVSVGDMARINAFKPQGMLSKAPPARLASRLQHETDLSRELDQLAATEHDTAWKPSRDAFSAKLNVPGASQYDESFTSELANRHERNAGQIDKLLKDSLLSGAVDGLDAMHSAISTSLDAAATDFDVFVCLGANPYAWPFPSRHSQHAAMLSIAVGSMLGLDETSLTELATGCLIHDVGMLAIPPALIEANRMLNEAEYAEVTKHPFTTFSLLEKHLDTVPVASRMVAYQMHERSNGSGYPRQRRGAGIHPLARIAAVTDSYTALVAQRPHRRGMLPYYAIETMVRDAGRGLYDIRVVRALLETVGLFPIGSYVELSNGYVARVIRGNGAKYAQPVVEAWKPFHLNADPAIVNLAEESSVRIARPLVSLGM